MRTPPGHRLPTFIAWVVILGISGWIVASVVNSGPGGSEKLSAKAEASAQQAIMTPIVNGLMAEPFRAQGGPQLSGIDRQVESLAFPDDPGSELGTAALLTRLGQRDKALAMLTTLRARIDSGEVEADESFRGVLDATIDLVDAAGEPGTRTVAGDRCALVEQALGPTGATLVAQALGQQERLTELEAAGMKVLGALAAATIAVLLLGLAGIALLVVFVVLAALGKTAGLAVQPQDRNHVYVEVFAVWLAAYVAWGRIADATVAQWGAGGGAAPSAEADLGLSLVGALVAAGLGLWWGTRRGLDWPSLRAGLGLARFSAMDLVWGVATWSMGIVLLVFGLLTAVLLSNVFGDGTMRPSHPIQQLVQDSGGLGLLLTYALACVCAPVFEEIFFRGALYRNLRVGLGRWGALGAPVAAALASSVLFAAIHPQGLVFVPVLGSLALAFCIMREWRGTINAPIVAHAINNGVVLTLNVLLLRG